MWSKCSFGSLLLLPGIQRGPVRRRFALPPARPPARVGFPSRAPRLYCTLRRRRRRRCGPSATQTGSSRGGWRWPSPAGELETQPTAFVPHADMTKPMPTGDVQPAGSSEVGQGMLLPQSSHLVTIPHPQHPHFVVSILHLRDSLFVWCAEAYDGEAASEEAQRYADSQAQPSSSTSLKRPEQTDVDDDAALQDAALASLSPEERRQLQVDQQMEEELSKAMEAAGRHETQQMAATPKGCLAKEWAVAMSSRVGAGDASATVASAGKAPSMGTSLFRTPADIALPMSRRLARRLEISQLHLCLDLPADLLSSDSLAAVGPGQATALLALERGIDEAIRSTRATPQA
ncbi:unnamed protein product [Parajaminaea phylloscopi]